MCIRDRFRKSDVRYTGIQDRFIDRLMLKNPLLNVIESKKVFNEDYSDSDGDGYSNLFERAIGSDSLGPDRVQDFPVLSISEDNRTRISFTRYKNDGISTINSAGEIFMYKVEQSIDLQTWSQSGIILERSVDLGGGLERQTWVTSAGLSGQSRRFLRVRVLVP